MSTWQQIVVGTPLFAIGLALTATCADEAPIDEPFEVTAPGEHGVLSFELRSDRPLVEGRNDLHVIVMHDGDPLPDAQLQAWVQMPAMTHGGAAPPVVVDGDGQFVLAGVDMPMPGEWLLSLRAESGDFGDSVFVWLVVP